MTQADRARLITEIRASRERHRAAGLAAGWKDWHIDALLEEIDTLKAKAKGASE